MDYHPGPSAPPPSYAVISKVYTRSLRPVVAATTAFAAVYAGIWSISAFNDIGDDGKVLKRLVVFDVVLGILYLGVFVIETFGIASAWLQRARLVRMYTFASLLAALMVIAAEILRIIVHFMFKSTIISSCATDLQSSGDQCFDRGRSCDNSPPLNKDDANDFCNTAFTRATFADIGWFIAATILSLLFASIAFGYYHQLQTAGTRVAAPTHIGMQDFPPTSYDPPNYPPPGGAPTNAAYGVAPPYQGPAYGSASNDFGGEKAPGYEYSLSGADGKHPADVKRSQFEEEDVGYDMGGSHRSGNTTQNPFR